MDIKSVIGRKYCMWLVTVVVNHRYFTNRAAHVKKASQHFHNAVIDSVGSVSALYN